jgi:hypothetical protein
MKRSGKKIAEQIFKDNDWRAFDHETMARCVVAPNATGEPVLEDIIGIAKGHDFRYLAMLELIQHVGKGNTFLTTPPVDDEPELFQRLVDDGVLEKGKSTNDPVHPFRWKVAMDPHKALENYIDSPGTRKSLHINVMGIGTPAPTPVIA